MSVRYVPVGWSRTKLVYDAILLAGVTAYLQIFIHLGPVLQPAIAPPDHGSLGLRAYGTCAFLLLTLLLCIGPLARLDRRFLPLLYNRRHFGVITCSVAAGHAWHVLGWYFAFADIDPYTGALIADTSFLQLRGFPFIPFGIAALAIMTALAATSHDFWLNFLTPPVWKRLHMGIYAAYALMVLHVAMGALQSSANPVLAMVTAASVAVVTGLHLLARHRPPPPPEGDWIDAGPLADIADGHGITVQLGAGRAAAIFRDGDTLAAIDAHCAHQNGPLGEGRVIDGCITCPWHGFQYRLTDGCAPAPFTEKLATYRLDLRDGRVWLDRRANPPGTPQEPLRLGGWA